MRERSRRHASDANMWLCRVKFKAPSHYGVTASDGMEVRIRPAGFHPTVRPVRCPPFRFALPSASRRPSANGGILQWRRAMLCPGMQISENSDYWGY